MSHPLLPELLRWVKEMPSAFLAPPASGRGSGVQVDAIVTDLFESLFDARPSKKLLRVCRARRPSDASLRHVRWILVAVHVLWFRRVAEADLDRERIEAFLLHEMADVAAIEDVDGLVDDEERREELVRRVLRAAGVPLEGESPQVAEDRLRQVDLVVRADVLAQAEAREKRARSVREAMRRRAAEEAAAKICRE